MIARRELLRWAGLGATNLLGLGCISPGAAMTGHDEWVDPTQAAFILFVKPTGSVHVVARQGQSLGAFEPALTHSAPLQQQVRGIPAHLQPIAQHPLHHFQSLDEQYPAL